MPGSKKGYEDVIKLLDKAIRNAENINRGYFRQLAAAVKKRKEEGIYTTKIVDDTTKLMENVLNDIEQCEGLKNLCNFNVVRINQYLIPQEVFLLKNFEMPGSKKGYEDVMKLLDKGIRNADRINRGYIRQYFAAIKQRDEQGIDTNQIIEETRELMKNVLKDIDQYEALKKFCTIK